MKARTRAGKPASVSGGGDNDGRKGREGQRYAQDLLPLVDHADTALDLGAVVGVGEVHPVERRRARCKRHNGRSALGVIRRAEEDGGLALNGLEEEKQGKQGEQRQPSGSEKTKDDGLSIGALAWLSLLRTIVFWPSVRFR